MALQQQKVRYGLHRDQELDTWWLIQKGSATNAVGLPNDTVPFKQWHLEAKCPHNIDLFDSNLPAWEQEWLEKLVAQDLFLEMSPIPTQSDFNTFYVPGDSFAKDVVPVVRLLEMHNPTMPLSMPKTMFSKDEREKLFKHFERTNISRFVIFGLDKYDAVFVDVLSKMMMGRGGKLFLCGPENPIASANPLIKTLHMPQTLRTWLETSGADKAFVRKAGARVLRDFMRGEKYAQVRGSSSPD